MLEISFRIYFYYNFNEKKFEMANLEGTNLNYFIRPNEVIKNYKFQTSLNSDGFRGINYSLEKPKNTTRIAIIGDSFTFGFGIKNTSDTYPKVLETLLNNNSNQKYEVMNFGMRGANILDIYWILKYNVLKYSPDIVIYGYFPNDPEFLKNNLDVNYCNLFYDSKLSIINFFEIKYDNLLNRFKKELNITDWDIYFEELVDDDYYGWKCFKGVINEMPKLNHDKNMKLLMFSIQNNEGMVQIEINTTKKVYNVAKYNSIAVIQDFPKSFWDKTEGYSENELRIDPENGEYHYNERGNRFIAEIIYSYMKNNTS